MLVCWTAPEISFWQGKLPRCVELCIYVATELGVPLGAALELGGGAGRTAFEFGTKVRVGARHGLFFSDTE